MRASACFTVVAGGLWLLAVARGPAVAASTGLAVHDGRVSGTVAGASTRSALEELTRRLGGRLSWHGGGAERPVSLELADVPITEAVARLVPGRSFVLVEDTHGGVREIRVLSGPDGAVVESSDATASRPGTGRPAAPTSLRVLADVERAARDPDAVAVLEGIARGKDVLRVRMAALERLARLEAAGIDPLLAAADGLWGAELAPRALALLERFRGEDARIDRLLREAPIRDGGS